MIGILFKLFILAVALYGLGFAGYTLWRLNEGDTLEESVKKGAKWLPRLISEIRNDSEEDESK